MSKQRVSLHMGKKSQKSGKIIKPPHNDESREKNENVKKEWTGNNFYWSWFEGEYTEDTKDGKLTFQKAEHEYYEKHYKEALELQNDKYIAARQKNRIKTIDDWLSSPRYAPSETILRIGNVDDGFADRLSLKEMAEEYIASLNEWSALHNNCLHVLDYALHADEYYVNEDTGEITPSSTHVHIRYVWDYIDEKGIKRIGCDKALELAGYELPDEVKSNSYTDGRGRKRNTKNGTRYNNRLKLVTAEFRKCMQEIAIAHGYDIETEPLPTKRKAKDKTTYVAEKRANISEKRANEREKQAAEEIVKAQILQAEYDKKLTELTEREVLLEIREQNNAKREKAFAEKEQQLEEKLAEAGKIKEEAIKEAEEIRNENKNLHSECENMREQIRLLADIMSKSPKKKSGIFNRNKKYEMDEEQYEAFIALTKEFKQLSNNTLTSDEARKKAAQDLNDLHKLKETEEQYIEQAKEKAVAEATAGLNQEKKNMKNLLKRKSNTFYITPIKS